MTRQGHTEGCDPWKDAEGCLGEQAFCRKWAPNRPWGCVQFESVEERGVADWGSRGEWLAGVLSKVSCRIVEPSRCPDSALTVVTLERACKIDSRRHFADRETRAPTAAQLAGRDTTDGP